MFSTRDESSMRLKLGSRIFRISVPLADVFEEFISSVPRGPVARRTFNVRKKYARYRSAKGRGRVRSDDSRPERARASGLGYSVRVRSRDVSKVPLATRNRFESSRFENEFESRSLERDTRLRRRSDPKRKTRVDAPRRRPTTDCRPEEDQLPFIDGRSSNARWKNSVRRVRENLPTVPYLDEQRERGSFRLSNETRSESCVCRSRTQFPAGCDSTSAHRSTKNFSPDARRTSTRSHRPEINISS